MKSKPIFTRAVIYRKARVLFFAIPLLTVLGPFGTYFELDAAKRVVYWGVILLPGAAIYEFSIAGFLYHHRLSRLLGRWQRFFLGVLVGSFVCVWIVIGAEVVIRDRFDPSLIPLLFCYVLIIGGVISLMSFMHPMFVQPEDDRSSEIDFERVAFYDRYPEMYGKRLRWVSMEDHYARAVMDGQEVTLHISMRELEELLVNYPGIRIHRSHWVAYDAVVGVKKDGRKTVADMGHNTKLPIGKKYQNRVEPVLIEKASEIPRRVS